MGQALISGNGAFIRRDNATTHRRDNENNAITINRHEVRGSGRAAFINGADRTEHAGCEMMKKIHSPLDDRTIAVLKAGDEVLLSGTVYTARDQAHLRMCRMLRDGRPLPVDLKGQVIYYCGPSPAGSRVIGSCGPTTAGRMDPFTPELLDEGLRGMIGKGRRSPQVIDAVKASGAVYFLAPGGAGAYLSGKVLTCETAAFADLGPEAIYRLEVENIPLIVGIDCTGRDIYDNL
jgi:fumarate hydratase subunit beta